MLQHLFLFLLLTTAVSAQTDSTRWLKEIRVHGKRLSDSNTTVRSDTLATTPAKKLSAGNLAAQLDREANIFIRNYGTGNLSSFSMRGTGASQSAVLWNGLQVQSPMLGLYDLTLLPSFLFGSAEIRYGGCSPAAGSGAMGGALMLKSAASILNGFEASAFVGNGSYGHQQTGIAIEAGTTKLSSRSAVYRQQSANNFRFTGAEGQQQEQTNAAFSQAGAAQDLSWKTQYGTFELHAWYLENRRQIPPHMLTTVSKQEQDDQSIRTVAEWNRNIRKWQYQVRSGWSREKIIYRDPAALLDEKSVAWIIQPEASISYHLNKSLTLTAEAEWVENLAQVEYYGKQRKSTSQQTISAGAFFSRQQWDIQAIVRSGIFNGNILPVLPSLSLFHYAEKWPSFRFEAATVYRNPTLNDLYWQPGGNENLKPESGYSIAGSAEKIFSRKTVFAKANAGAFYSSMDELLTWLPQSNGIYSAVNLNKVETKGLEGSLHARTCFKKINFRITANAQYNLAVLKESSAAISDGINKQLIYTPRILIKGQAEILFKEITLSYFHGYTGYRYVTQDHSYYLEPFATGEVVLSYSRQLKNFGVMLFGNIKNCWDTGYQVIALRAMPGRYYESGLLLTFTKKKK